MTIKDEPRPLPARQTGWPYAWRSERAATAGGLVGALAATSCCLLPLALLGLGVGGAWIGYLTRLAPYQPYFLAISVACIAVGYWQLRRAKSCAPGETCAVAPDRLVRIGLILASVLIAAVIGFNLLAPLLAAL